MITSIQNPLIKQYRSLEKMRSRKNTGLTILEGPRTLKHAYENDWEISSVLYVPSKIKKSEKELIDKCRNSGVWVEEISIPLLQKLSRREGPLGVLSIIKWHEKYTLESLPLSKNPLILVAESIEKPGNLGVLIRSASASGAEAVILCDPLTTFHEPSCIHSSLGSVFTLPCVTTSTKNCLDWMKKMKITPVITTPEGKLSYTKYDFTKPSAIVMGNEHNGVSNEFLTNGVTAKIDMHGKMDSLNVSVAGAIFLFEALRQRKHNK